MGCAVLGGRLHWPVMILAQTLRVTVSVAQGRSPIVVSSTIMASRSVSMMFSAAISIWTLEQSAGPKMVGHAGYHKFLQCFNYH